MYQVDFKATNFSHLLFREDPRRDESWAHCQTRHAQSKCSRSRQHSVRCSAEAASRGGHCAGNPCPPIALKLTGGHADNYLVQNVSRSLISRFVVKYAVETVQDTHRYDIYEIFKDLFLTVDEREEMLLEGIQSTKLNKIRSDAGNKETSGVDTEKALESVYKNKYKINLDHEILTDHGVFYPQAPLHDLAFELTLAPASQLVRGSDATKLVYKLTNIQLEYGVIRSKTLSDDATSAYRSGKEFAYDFVMREQVVDVNRGEDSWLDIRVNPQRRSLKGLLLLFTAPYTLGARDSENYENPNITKVHVTINGVPAMTWAAKPTWTNPTGQLPTLSKAGIVESAKMLSVFSWPDLQ